MVSSPFEQNSQLNTVLQELGLSHNEVVVYSTLLRIGSNPASTIARKAQLNRSNCYSILDQLKERGLIALTFKNNIRYFSGIDPCCLIDELKNKKTFLEQKIEHLMISVRQFTIPNKTPVLRTPKVVFFEGRAGVRQVLEQTLQAHETLRAYAPLDELISFLPGYFPGYYHRRSSKKISVRALYPATKKSYYHKLYDEKESRVSRLIPTTFTFPMGIVIYDDTVVIISLREMFGMVIKSHHLAESKKCLFDLIWKSVEEYDREITKEFAKKDKETP